MTAELQKKDIRRFRVSRECLVLILRSAAVTGWLAEHIQNAQYDPCQSKSKNAVPPSAGSEVITEQADDNPHDRDDPADCHNHTPHFYPEYEGLKARSIVPWSVWPYSAKPVPPINRCCYPIDHHCRWNPLSRNPYRLLKYRLYLSRPASAECATSTCHPAPFAQLP